MTATLLLASLASLALAAPAPDGTSAASVAAIAAAAPPAVDKNVLPITPGPMGFERLRDDLGGLIAQEEAREAFYDELARIWDRYYLAWDSISRFSIESQAR